MEICKNEVENYESESSEESEKIENASKKSIVGFQHHKSVGEMKGFGERKSMPCKIKGDNKLKDKVKMDLVISRIKSQTDESKFSASSELFGDEKKLLTEGDEDVLNEMKRKEINGFEGWPKVSMGGFEHGCKNEGNSFSEDFAGEIEVMMASDFIGSIEQDNPFLNDLPAVKTKDPQAIFSLISSNLNLFDQSVESPILKTQSLRKLHVKTRTHEVVGPIEIENHISDPEIIASSKVPKNQIILGSSMLCKQESIQEDNSEQKISIEVLSQKEKKVQNPIDEPYKAQSPKSKKPDKNIGSNKGYNKYSCKYEKNISSSESSKSSNNYKNSYRFQNESKSSGSSKNSINTSENPLGSIESLGTDKITTNDAIESQIKTPKIPKPMFKFTSKNTETLIKNTNFVKQEKPLLLCSNTEENAQEIIVDISDFQIKMREKKLSPKISEEEIVYKNDSENIRNKGENHEGLIILEEDTKENTDKVLEIEIGNKNQKGFENSSTFFTPEISLKSKISGKNKKKQSKSSSSSSESKSFEPKTTKKTKASLSNRKTPFSTFIKTDILPTKILKKDPGKLIPDKKSKNLTDFSIPCNNINTQSPYFINPILKITKSSKDFKTPRMNFEIISCSSIVINKTPQESISSSSSNQKNLQDYIKITPPSDQNTLKNHIKNEEIPTQVIENEQNMSNKYKNYHNNKGIFPKTKSLGKISLKKFQPVVVSKHFRSSVNLLKANDNSPKKSLGNGQNRNIVIEEKSDSKTPQENMCQDIDFIII
ncbi:hypothetical protein SteCoe_31111 [Stentor coeruleus]|uniref:Uncharacterized protein n=1 Tax=Stentor coeruleus TaxID=5963 RepID=A0A1R2B228_9CILI|nr:hypothetical protein SteCoe_31111 [Stentor coeruleus]